MTVDDGFFDWLLEAYDEGSLTIKEIDKALECRYNAYNLYIEMWSSDKYATGEMAQTEIERVKKFIQNRESKRNGNKT